MIVILRVWRPETPTFEFQARPVIAVEDAVRVELDAIAWRDGLKRN